jgi:hypothetical protein
MIHVYNDLPMFLDSRHKKVQRSWKLFYRQTGCIPLKYSIIGRKTSRELVGDDRTMPVVNDMISEACGRIRLDDIVILTNNDSGLCSDAADRIVKLGYSCRFDLATIPTLPPSSGSLERKYGGVDLVCVTPRWWYDHRSSIPNMFLGCEAWDWLFKIFILMNGGYEIDPPIVYHERHGEPYWKQHRTTNRGNLWNRYHAKQWAKSVDIDFVEMYWPNIKSYEDRFD